MDVRVRHAVGIVTIVDANTTIAYCRYDGSGEIEYLFVGPAFRRRGHARRMLELVEAHVGNRLRFASPISPLGRCLVEAYSRDRGIDPAEAMPPFTTPEDGART
jgi:ribosomal protein S18 acetylase RimI-like enzyme